MDVYIEESVKNLFSLVSVGSKRFLTNKVDRSVTGCIVQQQCVGLFIYTYFKLCISISINVFG